MVNILTSRYFIVLEKERWGLALLVLLAGINFNYPLDHKYNRWFTQLWGNSVGADCLTNLLFVRSAYRESADQTALLSPMTILQFRLGISTWNQSLTASLLVDICFWLLYSNNRGEVHNRQLKHPLSWIVTRLGSWWVEHRVSAKDRSWSASPFLSASFNCDQLAPLY